LYRIIIISNRLKIDKSSNYFIHNRCLNGPFFYKLNKQTPQNDIRDYHKSKYSWVCEFQSLQNGRIITHNHFSVFYVAKLELPYICTALNADIIGLCL